MATINGISIGNVSAQNFLIFLFMVIFTFVLGGIVNILITKFLRGKARPVVYKTMSKIAMYSIYALGLYFAFNKIINFNITAGLAALGILGIALLLPTIPILQNIVAGFVIAIERPFKEEDIIEIDNTLCIVKDITLAKTKLRALDGKIITISNHSFIGGRPIINYSKGEFIKVSSEIAITTDSSINKAREIINKICYDNPNILPNVPEKKLDRITKIISIPKNFFATPKNIKALSPRIMIKDVNKDKIMLEVWFWIWNILLKESITSAFYERLITEFKKEDIKLG